MQMVDKSGKLVDVPDDKTQEAFASGQYGFKKGSRVPVVNQAGEVGTIDASTAQQAFADGVRPATGEEVKSAELEAKFGGAGSTVAAGAIGVGRGLTLGLSDPLALGVAGLVGGHGAREKTREYLEGQKDAHPVASVAGEVAGAIAPVLLSGGAGAAAEAGEGISLARGAAQGIKTIGSLPRAAAGLGEAAEHVAAGIVGHGAESVLGRVAQRGVATAAQAGAEGALYGAGATISEASLGDEELTAEKLLAGAKHGAMLGAITGGVLGGGYELAKGAVDKGLKIAGKEGLLEFLKDVRSNQMGRALGMDVGNFRRLGGAARTAEASEEKLASITDTLMSAKLANGERVFKGTISQRELAENVAKAAEESGEKLGDLRARIADAVDADIAKARAAQTVEHARSPGLAAGEVPHGESPAPHMDLDAAVAANDAGVDISRGTIEHGQSPGVSKKLPDYQAANTNAGRGKRISKMEIGVDGGTAANDLDVMSSVGTHEASPRISVDLPGGAAANDLDRSIAVGSRRAANDFAITGEASTLAPDVSGYLTSVRRELIEPNMGPMSTPAQQRLAKKMLGELRPLLRAEEEGRVVTLRELEEIKQAYRRELYPRSVNGISVPPPHADLLNQAVGMLEKTIEETTDRTITAMGVPELQGAYQAMKREYSDMISAKKIIDNAHMRAVGRNVVGLGDKMTSIGIGAGALAKGVAAPQALMGAMLAGAAHKFVMSHGNAAAAALADRAAKIIAIQRAASHVDEKMARSITAFLTDRHEAHALAHLAEKTGHVAREAVKGTYEAHALVAGSAHEAEPGKHAVVAAGSYVAAAHGPHAQTLADKREPLHDAANANMTRLENVAKSVGPLAVHAPKTAAALASKAANMQQNLQRQLPKPSSSGAGVILPNKQKPRFSESDAVRFERYQRAATDPLSVLDDMKARRLTPAAVQGLKDNSPRLYQEMQTKILEHVASAKTPPDYETRKQLGVLFGVPTDPLLAPGFKSAMAQLYAQTPAEPQQGAPQPASGGPKRQIHTAESHRTMTESLASGD